MATAAIPEPIPDRTDVQKYIRFAVLDRVAHVGMILDKMQRQIRRAEGYELMAATGEMKYLTDAVAQGDDMAVNIGNETHYHYQGAPPTETTPATTTGETNGGTNTGSETTDEEEAGDDDEEAEPPAPAPEPAPAVATAIPAASNGLWKYMAPVLIGAAMFGGGALYQWATSKPESVTSTTITHPSGKFEYRYGIEQRPTPAQ